MGGQIVLRRRSCPPRRVRFPALGRPAPPEVGVCFLPCVLARAHSSRDPFPPFWICSQGRNGRIGLWHVEETPGGLALAAQASTTISTGSYGFCRASATLADLSTLHAGSLHTNPTPTRRQVRLPEKCTPVAPTTTDARDSGGYAFTGCRVCRDPALPLERPRLPFPGGPWRRRSSSTLPRCLPGHAARHRLHRSSHQVRRTRAVLTGPPPT